MTTTTKPNSPAHARARRKAHIQAIMTAGEWETGKTGKLLAAEWGVTPKAVRYLAAEVSKELGWKADDEAKRRVFDVLDEAEDVAREVLAAAPEGREECAPLELRLRAAKALADVARARADALGMRGSAPTKQDEPGDTLPAGFTTDGPKPRDWS